MAVWDYWKGILVLILIISGTGTYYLQSTGKYDICTKGGVRGSWVRTAWGADGYYRHYCRPENKVKWCSELKDYGSTKNARCYTMEEVYHESPESKTENLTVHDFFGGLHLASGEHFTFAEHSVNPKNFYDNDDCDVFLTYEVIVKKGDGIKNWVVERKVFYKQPIYGTKQVCEWNEDNQTDNCWIENDEKNITSYKTLYKFENNETNKTRISINSGEQPELKTKFFLFKNVFEQNYLIDVIPIIEVIKKDTEETYFFAQREWVDISPISDLLLGYWDGDGNVTTDGATLSAQCGTNNFFASSDTPVWGSSAQCKTNECMNINDDWYVTYNDNANHCFFQEDWTVCQWLYITTDGNEYFWHFSTDAGSMMRQGFSDSYRTIFGANEVITNSTVPLNEWYYLCTVFDASVTTIEYFVNGTAWGTGSTGDTPAGAGNKTFGMGCHLTENPPVDVDFEGRIDSVSYWNTTLPPADIASLYANNGIPLLLTDLLFVKQWVEVQSIDSTTITYNLTVFVYNNYTASLTVIMDPDDGFSTETYTMTLAADEENVTYFTNTTTRGSADVMFYVQPPNIIGDTTATGNGLHLVGPSQGTADECDLGCIQISAGCSAYTRDNCTIIGI